MITTKARLIIAFSLIVIFIFIVNMVRRRSLELKYVLVWLGCDIAMLIFVAFPQLLDRLAELLGVYSVTNMIFFIGYFFLLVICFFLTIAISRTTGRLRHMAQVISMLPEEVKQNIMDQLARQDEQGKKEQK